MIISLRPMQSAALLELNKGKGANWTPITGGEVALTILDAKSDRPRALISWRENSRDKPYPLAIVDCAANTAETEFDTEFHAALKEWGAD